MKGLWRVKDANLSMLCAKARELVRDFEKVEFNYVPREQNIYADNLANQALDQAGK
jgi:probable phosphoglycerate mutase